MKSAPRYEVGECSDAGGHGALPYFCFFLYMASMRWVTRNPPKMFTDASIRATKPNHLGEADALPGLDCHREQRPDHDHRGDGVGHGHQRRVQRRGHAPYPRSTPRKSRARRWRCGRQKDRSGRLRPSWCPRLERCGWVFVRGRQAQLAGVRARFHRSRGRVAGPILDIPESGAPQSAGRNEGWTMLPPLVSPVPVTTSSFQSNSITPPSVSTNGDTKLYRFRA